MPLNAREVLVIIRAQDQASRTIRGVSNSFGVLAKRAAASEATLQKTMADTDRRMANVQRSAVAQIRSFENGIAQSAERQTAAIRKHQDAINRTKIAYGEQFRQQVDQHKVMQRANTESAAHMRTYNSLLREQMHLHRTGQINRMRDPSTGRFISNSHVKATNLLKANEAEIARLAEKNAQIQTLVGNARQRNVDLMQRDVGVLKNAMDTERRRHADFTTQSRDRMSAIRRWRDDEIKAIRDTQQAAKAAHVARMRDIDAVRARASHMQAGGQAMMQGGVVSAFIGAAGVAGYVLATKAAADYSKEAALAMTQTDKVKVSLEDLKEIGRRVAVDIGAPFDEMQTALYDIFSSLDLSNVAEAEHLLREMSRAAVAGQVDVQTASRGTIAIMNAFGYAAKDVTHVNDVMFQMVRKGIGTYQELASKIGLSVSSTNAAGQSVETLAAMITYLTRTGLPASRAFTSAARALDAFANPNTQANVEALGVSLTEMVDGKKEFRPLIDVLTELQGKFKDLGQADLQKAIYDLFLGSGGTIQAKRFWNQVFQEWGTGENNFIERLEEFGPGRLKGATKDAFSVMEAEATTQFQKLSNSFQAFTTRVGDRFTPLAIRVSKALREIFDAFGRLDPVVQGNIVRWGAYASVFLVVAGAGAVLVGAFVSLIGMMTLWLGTASKAILVLLKFGGGFGLLMAALTLAIINFDKFKEILWQSLPVIAAVAVALRVKLLAALLGLTRGTIGTALGVMFLNIKALGSASTGSAAKIAILRGAFMGLKAAFMSFAPMLIVAGIVFGLQKMYEHFTKNRKAAEAFADTVGQDVDTSTYDGARERIRLLEDQYNLATEALKKNKAALEAANNVDPAGSNVDLRTTEGMAEAKAELAALEANHKQLTDAVTQGSHAQKALKAEIAAVKAEMGATIPNLHRIMEEFDLTSGQAAKLAANAGVNLVHAFGDKLPGALKKSFLDVKNLGPVSKVLENNMDDLGNTTQSTSAIFEAFSGSVDSYMGAASAFTRATEEAKAAQTKLAEGAVEDGETMSEATRKSIEEMTASLSQWEDALDEQFTTHQNFMKNIATITARGGGDIIDVLLKMGEDGPAAAAKLADAAPKEFERMNRKILRDEEIMSEEYKTRWSNMFETANESTRGGMAISKRHWRQGMKVIEVLARDGMDQTAEQIDKKLGIGVDKVRQRAAQMGLELAGGLNPVLQGIGAKTIAVFGQNGQQVGKLNSGGFVRGSGPDKDSILTYLTPKEFVLRRKAATKVPKRALEVLNRTGDITAAATAVDALPRNEGGFITAADVPKTPYMGDLGDKFGYTGKSAMDYTREKVVKWLEKNALGGNLVQIGRKLQQMGARVTGHAAFGGTPTSGHATKSLHYVNRAIDVNYGPGGQNATEMAFLDRIYPMLAKLNPTELLWRVKNHFDHLHLAFAKGGVVTGPTRALIGERGPEAVMPLNGLYAAMGSAVEKGFKNAMRIPKLNRVERTVRQENRRNRGLEDKLEKVTNKLGNVADRIREVRGKIKDKDTTAAQRTKLTAELGDLKQRRGNLRERAGNIRGRMSTGMLEGVQTIRNFNEAKSGYREAVREIKAADNAMARLQNQAKRLDVQYERTFRQLAEARVEATKVSLEEEAGILRASDAVKQLSDEYNRMKAGRTDSQKLESLQQKEAVARLQEEYDNLKKVGVGGIRDQGAVDSAQQAVKDAETALQSADAAHKSAMAMLDQKGADVALANFEVARIRQVANAIRPSDNVKALLLEYQAAAELAKSQTAYAEANEEAAKAATQVNDANKALTDANRSLNDVMREQTVTADQLEMKRLELAIASQRLIELDKEGIYTTDQLRLKEIELTLAMQERDRLIHESTLPTSEAVVELETKLAEIEEKRTQNLADQKAAAERMKAAQDGLFTATITLLEAQMEMDNIKPRQIAFYNDIMKSVQNTTKAIHAFNDTQRNVSVPGGTKHAVTSIVNSVYGDKSFATSTETAAQRIRRITEEVESGAKTLEQVTRSINWSYNKTYPGMAAGGRVMASGLSWVGEAGPELLNLPRGATVTPLTPVGAPSVSVTIEGGAVQVNLNGPIDSATLPQVKQTIDDAFAELVKELKS